MAIIWMIIIGFVIGLVARALMPGTDPAGFVMTVILGIVGAIVAGYLGQFLNIYRPGEPAGFIASVLGAMLVLFIYRTAIRGRAGRGV